MKKLFLALLTLSFGTLFNTHTFAADSEAASSSAATDPIADTAICLKTRWSELLEHVSIDRLKVFIGENLVAILSDLHARSSTDRTVDDDRITKTCLHHALRDFGNPRLRKK